MAIKTSRAEWPQAGLSCPSLNPPQASLPLFNKIEGLIRSRDLRTAAASAALLLRIYILHYLIRTLSYGNDGTFLILGTAGFISSSVVCQGQEHDEVGKLSTNC